MCYSYGLAHCLYKTIVLCFAACWGEYGSRAAPRLNAVVSDVDGTATGALAGNDASRIIGVCVCIDFDWQWLESKFLHESWLPP